MQTNVNKVNRMHKYQIYGIMSMTNKTIRTTLVAMLAVTLAVSAVAATMPYADAKNSNPNVAPLNTKKYEENHEKWWELMVTLPTDENPFTDKTGENCLNGLSESGKIIYLAGASPETVRECTIASDTKIFFPIINIAGTGVTEEDAEFFAGLTEIIMDEDNVFDLSVTVDGVELENLESYRIQSNELFDIEPVEGNPFAVPEEIFAKSDGYWILLNPLSSSDKNGDEPGDHTIEFSGSTEADLGEFGVFSFETAVTYHITVE